MTRKITVLAPSVLPVTVNATARTCLVVNHLLQASDSGHVFILSLRDLSAAFDTIDHYILNKRLHTLLLFWYGCGLVHLLPKFPHSVCFCWSRNNSSLSAMSLICQSVHSYHFFADDSQLHNSSIPSYFPALVHSLKDCIEDVAEWMSDSMLKMNDD